MFNSIYRRYYKQTVVSVCSSWLRVFCHDDADIGCCWFMFGGGLILGSPMGGGRMPGGGRIPPGGEAFPLEGEKEVLQGEACRLVEASSFQGEVASSLGEASLVAACWAFCVRLLDRQQLKYNKRSILVIFACSCSYETPASHQSKSASESYWFCCNSHFPNLIGWSWNNGFKLRRTLINNIIRASLNFKPLFHDHPSEFRKGLLWSWWACINEKSGDDKLNEVKILLVWSISVWACSSIHFW